jgi:hypothetical protein
VGALGGRDREVQVPGDDLGSRSRPTSSR